MKLLSGISGQLAHSSCPYVRAVIFEPFQPAYDMITPAMTVPVWAEGCSKLGNALILKPISQTLSPSVKRGV